MQRISNVALIGLGAIGSIYATALQEYDPACLRVIVDAARKDRYTQEGVIFRGKRYDFTYVTPSEITTPADLILIATKAGGLDAAIEMIAPLVGPATQILPLLNGITSEDTVAARYGWEHVLYAFFTGHISTRQGRTVLFDGTGTLVFGEAENRTLSTRVAALRDFFDAVGIRYQIPEDMLFALWRKFIVNVGFNQASAVLRAPYGVFQTCDAAVALARELMDECAAVARQVGIHHPEDLIRSGMEIITTQDPASKSSMLQDVEAGRPTEVALFGETLCQLGERHHVPTPMNATFARIITAIDQAQTYLQKRADD
jgi:2-dehydropantoate 2-reductase